MALDTNVLYAIIIGGSILGGIGRQMLPYIRKLAIAEQSDQPPVVYKHRYTFTTVFAVIVAGVVGMTLFPQLLATLPVNPPIVSVFITSFLMAWGSTDLFNNVSATGAGNPTAPATATTAAKTTSSTATATSTKPKETSTQPQQ